MCVNSGSERVYEFAMNGTPMAVPPKGQGNMVHPSRPSLLPAPCLDEAGANLRGCKVDQPGAQVGLHNISDPVPNLRGALQSRYSTVYGADTSESIN